MTFDPRQLPVGQRIADTKWVMCGLLGEGGMGVVLDVVKDPGIRGAMKMMQPHYAQRPDLVALFLDEILDAVVISPDLVGADGQGDTMARTPAAQGGGGLSAANPTGSQEELAKFEAAHKEEVAHWPEWRKVEIDIRGRFFFTVVTVSQDESP